MIFCTTSQAMIMVIEVITVAGNAFAAIFDGRETESTISLRGMAGGTALWGMHLADPGKR